MSKVLEFRFSNCTATGRLGPTQEQVNNAYVGTLLEGKVSVNIQGVQEWVVPKTGDYIIEVFGAQGGKGCGTHDSAYGGKGARVSSKVRLYSGYKLLIIVGQKGTDHPGTGGDGTTGAGGGGSFVVIEDPTSPHVFVSGIKVSPLLIAAGGNGGRDVGYSGAGTIYHGLHTDGNSNFFSQTYSGGGFSESGNKSLGVTCGNSFLQGGMGSSNVYSRGGSSSAGFGGGGGNIDDGDGGGGGGYKGGYRGVSAGSFNSGTEQFGESGVNTGDGKVVITIEDSNRETSGIDYLTPIDVSDITRVSNSISYWDEHKPVGSVISITHSLAVVGTQQSKQIDVGNGFKRTSLLPSFPVDHDSVVIKRNGNVDTVVIEGNKVIYDSPIKGFIPESLQLDLTNATSGDIIFTKGLSSMKFAYNDGSYRLKRFLQSVFGIGNVNVFGGINATEDRFDTTDVETYWAPTFANKVCFKKSGTLYKVMYKPMAIGHHTLKIKNEDGSILLEQSFITDNPATWLYLTLEVPVVVSIGDTFLFEFTRPTGAIYATSVEEYNGELWYNQGAFIGTFWGETYTIAMGFVFKHSEMSRIDIEFDVSVGESGLVVDSSAINPSMTPIITEYKPQEIITVDSYQAILTPGGSEWEPLVNGGELSLLPVGANLSGRFLMVKVMLESLDAESLPSIQDLTIEISDLSTTLKVI